MERLTEEDVRKLTAAQTNALCHWLRIPYGSKTGTTAEKRERVWRRIRDEEAGQLPRHVWKAVVEHSMAESMPAFDKKIRETGPRTPSKKDSIKVRYPSLTGPTAGAGRLTIEDLVGNSGPEQRSGAESRLGQADLPPPRHHDEDASDSDMSVDSKGSWQMVDGRRRK